MAVAEKRYDYSGPMTAALITTVLLLQLFFMFMFFMYLKTADLSGEIMSVFLLLASLLFLAATLMRISISIDDFGVSATIFGVVVKRIDWADIQEIKKMQSGLGLADTITIMDRRHHFPCTIFFNLCGPIVFTQHIGGYRDLLDRINVYAQEHKIPLAVMDKKAAAL